MATEGFRANLAADSLLKLFRGYRCYLMDSALSAAETPNVRNAPGRGTTRCLIRTKPSARIVAELASVRTASLVLKAESSRSALEAGLSCQPFDGPLIAADHRFARSVERVKWSIEMDEDYNAGDKCGRCGCPRRDHTPACTNHPKCKNFSASKAPKAKRR